MVVFAQTQPLTAPGTVDGYITVADSTGLAAGIYGTLSDSDSGPISVRIETINFATRSLRVSVNNVYVDLTEYGPTGGARLFVPKQVAPNGYIPPSNLGIEIRDNNVPRGTASVLDFTGSSVSASVAEGVCSIVVSGDIVQFPNEVILAQDGTNSVKLSKQISLDDEPSIVWDLSPAIGYPSIQTTFSFATGPVSNAARGLGVFGVGPFSIHPNSGSDGLHIIPEFLPLPMNPGGFPDSYLFEFQQGMIDFHILRTDGVLVGDYPHLSAFYNDDEGRPEFGIGGEDFGILIRGFESGWGPSRPSDYTFGRFGGSGSIRFSIPSEDTPGPRSVSIDSLGGGANLQLNGWYYGRGVNATSFDNTPNTFVAWNNGTTGSTVQFPFFDLPNGGGRTSGIGVTQGETGDCANVDCFSLPDQLGNSCRSEISATAGAASFAFDFQDPGLQVVSRVYGRGDADRARVEVSSHNPGDPQTAYAAIIADKAEGYGKLVLSDVTPDGGGSHPSRTITVRDGYLSNTKPASRLNGVLVDPTAIFTDPPDQPTGASPFTARYKVTGGTVAREDGKQIQYWPGYGYADYHDEQPGDVLTGGTPVLAIGDYVTCYLIFAYPIGDPGSPGSYGGNAVQFWENTGASAIGDGLGIPTTRLQAAAESAIGGPAGFALIGVGELQRSGDLAINDVLGGIWTAGLNWSRD